ncbi:hypothetical protein [Streptomyces achromogenes]|uniref:hypothetical protein n=1 Tax=Streptomyces achromogenes TaxID=67255 RepID=UPI0036BE004C
MKRIQVTGCMALLGAVVGVLGGAVPAGATSVIGFGNAAFDNVCANLGGPRAGGGTVRDGGGLSGLGVALPVGSPGNQCGSLGLPTALHEEFGVDAIGTLTGGEV